MNEKNAPTPPSHKSTWLKVTLLNLKFLKLNNDSPKTKTIKLSKKSECDDMNYYKVTLNKSGHKVAQSELLILTNVKSFHKINLVH